MTKTKEALNDRYFKKYTIKSPSSKRAAAAHTIAKTDDANGNDDAVFTGSNVKMFDRHLEHGYNPGEDEEVYEQVQPLDELSRSTLRSYVQKAADDMYAAGKKSPHGGYDTYGKRWVGINKATAKLSDHPGLKIHSSEINKERAKQRKRLNREETDLQELSKKTLSSYIKKAADSQFDLGDKHAHAVRDNYDLNRDINSRIKAGGEARRASRKAFKRGVSIDRAVDKLTREETDLQELSKKTLGQYIKTASNTMRAHEDERQTAARNIGDIHKGHMAQSEYGRNARKLVKATRGIQNRWQGIVRATDKLTKEETDLQELSKDTLKMYIKKAGGNHIDGVGALMHSSARLDAAGRPKSAQKLYDKAIKRGRGVMKAVDKLTKEETEELQELSKRKLSSYTTRAAYDLADTARHGGTRPGTRESLKVSKRAHGIATAAQKLAGNRMVVQPQREETELQELSRDKLVHYIHKAAGDLAQKGANFSDSARKGQNPTKIGNKIAKRRQNVTKAAARLAYTGGHTPKQDIHLRAEDKED